MYKSTFKRTFDFVLALAGFLVFSPVFIVVMVLLTIANRGTPFFFQKRPGRNERIFKIVKFKTMTDARDSNGELLPDKDRLTKVGQWVRKLSLDEIPQLLNVIKGDMSLIGPRPLLVQYIPLYNDFQKRRHEVRPGITGWAQVNGRNTVGWKEKFEFDVWYVDHISLKLDLRIILKTIVKVFKTEGISAEGQATMSPFTGNE